MKILRTQLKEVIRKIVLRKLDEIAASNSDNNTTPKTTPTSEYGFIMQGKGSPENPVIQLSGYGNMPLNSWRLKIVKDLEEVLRHAKAGNFGGVLYLLGIKRLTPEDGSVLSNEINLIADLDESKSNLKESAPLPSNMVGQPTQPSNPNPQDPVKQQIDQNQPNTNTKPMTASDQRALADAQAEIQDLTAKRDQYKGAIKKLQEPIQRKVADINKRLAPIEQKLGLSTQKATNIQDKYKA